MLKLIIGSAMALLFLTSCASLGDFLDVFTGQQREKATRTPLYVYRGDLQIETDGQNIDGVGVVSEKNYYDIKVKSQIKLDRVEVESCGRQEVCQNGKPCAAEFDIDSTWFGSVGKKMNYRYVPSEHEKKCPIYIRVFDKRSLAAWGYLSFSSSDETLTAQIICNGRAENKTGRVACQTREGLIQRIKFSLPINYYSVDDICNIKKINDTYFELRPSLGVCRGKFLADGHYLSLEVFAYDSVLVRGE